MEREKRYKKNIQAFIADESVKIPRKYKALRQEWILPPTVSGIIPIHDDEVFIRLLDYRYAWISNYGRAVALYGGKYCLMHKKYIDGEITYQLYRNVYNGKEWTYEKQLVKAWKLVVQEFVINYDIANNICCWHIGNDKQDNYYKNLYPLNEKQYAAVRDKFETDGNDSEESILNIMNSVKYKADNWIPRYMKRTFCGVGYLGTKVDVTDRAYCKWKNMLQRCYSEKIHEYKPYYAPCTVCEEWLNFSNFKVWYDENDIGKKRDLDKDLLIKGNTVYAPDTCSLLTHYNNTVFESRGIKNSIVLNSKTGMYDAAVSLLGKRMEVGSFGTKEEANKGLFEYKRDYIRRYARKSKKRTR